VDTIIISQHPVGTLFSQKREKRLIAVFCSVRAGAIHSATIKFPNSGDKNHTKDMKIFINTITQYGLRPLRHNVYIVHTSN
jgi:hypothetical protein